MQARAFAQRGERRACWASLDQADRILSAIASEPDAEWIAAFDTASLASEAAICLRQLGDLPQRWWSAGVGVAGGGVPGEGAVAVLGELPPGFLFELVV